MSAQGRPRRFAKRKNKAKVDNGELGTPKHPAQKLAAPPQQIENGKEASRLSADSGSDECGEDTQKVEVLNWAENLGGLPAETEWHILMHLRTSDLLMMSMVNKTWNAKLIIKEKSEASNKSLGLLWRCAYFNQWPLHPELACTQYVLEQVQRTIDWCKIGIRRAKLQRKNNQVGNGHALWRRFKKNIDKQSQEAGDKFTGQSLVEAFENAKKTYEFWLLLEEFKARQLETRDWEPKSRLLAEQLHDSLLNIHISFEHEREHDGSLTGGGLTEVSCEVYNPCTGLPVSLSFVNPVFHERYNRGHEFTMELKGVDGETKLKYKLFEHGRRNENNYPVFRKDIAVVRNAFFGPTYANQLKNAQIVHLLMSLVVCPEIEECAFIEWEELSDAVGVDGGAGAAGADAQSESAMQVQAAVE